MSTIKILEQIFSDLVDTPELKLTFLFSLSILLFTFKILWSPTIYPIHNKYHLAPSKYFVPNIEALETYLANAQGIFLARWIFRQGAAHLAKLWKSC